MSHVIEDIGDGFEDLGHGIENLGKEIGKTIEGVLKDPLPMVLSVAGSFVGIPPWVTMAAVTAARGGDLEDVAKSAAVSFATSAFMTGTQIGADIQSYTSNSWAGDFTDVMTDTFDLSPTASVAVAKAATSALNGAIVGGMRAAIMGDDVLKGMGSGFTSGGVYSSVDSFFDSVNKDQDWGLSTKTLNLAKGAASTGIMAMISGKGDPAAAVGNYIAYASMKMGTSELSKNAKEAYNEFRKNADIAQESGENLKNVSDEYKAKQTEYEGKANEVESLITDYNSDLAKVAPVKAELDSIENEFNNFTGQRVELVAQYNDIQSQHDSYDARRSEFVTPVAIGDQNSNGGLEVIQQGGEDEQKILRDARGALYTPARDNEDNFFYRRIDAQFNAPDKEELLAQSNAIKNQVNAIDAKQNELLTKYNSTAESIKPITDNLDAKAKVVEEKIAEVKSIEKDIATPQGDNLAAKLKAASDKYNQDYEKYTTSQNEANAKAQTFEMAKAEVAVRDATIDAVNNGVIQVTAKNSDGSYTLSNGMTLDSNGKFFQNGEQVYSTAVGVPQSKLNFTDNENNKVSFDENAGRRMSTSDVQNILKRDYGIEVDENTAKQYSGTAYSSENTALKEYAQTAVNERNATQETERLKQAEITRVAEEKKAADDKEIAAGKAAVDKATEGLTNPPTYGEKTASNDATTTTDTTPKEYKNGDIKYDGNKVLQFRDNEWVYLGEATTENGVTTLPEIVIKGERVEPTVWEKIADKWNSIGGLYGFGKKFSTGDEAKEALLGGGGDLQSDGWLKLFGFDSKNKQEITIELQKLLDDPEVLEKDKIEAKAALDKVNAVPEAPKEEIPPIIEPVAKETPKVTPTEPVKVAEVKPPEVIIPPKPTTGTPTTGTDKANEPAVTVSPDEVPAPKPNTTVQTPTTTTQPTTPGPTPGNEPTTTPIAPPATTPTAPPTETPVAPPTTVPVTEPTTPTQPKTEPGSTTTQPTTAPVITKPGDAEIKTAIDNAIANIKFPPGISKDDVTSAINDAMAAKPGLKPDDVANSISKYMADHPTASVADVKAVADAQASTVDKVASLSTDLTKIQSDIDARIAELMAKGVTNQEATGAALKELGSGLTAVQQQQIAAAAEQKAAADKAASAAAATAAKSQMQKGMSSAMSFAALPAAAMAADELANQSGKIGLVTTGETTPFESPLDKFLKLVKGDSYAPKPQIQQQQPEQVAKVEDQLAPQQESNYFNYGSTANIDQLLKANPAQQANMLGLNAKTGGLVPPLMASGGTTRHGKYAGGGLNVINHQGKNRIDFRSGDAVTGAGDGQSDDIPAMLADGEFVFPADVVAALGNGSTKAGSDKLYDMMHSIRAHHRSARPEDLPPPAKKSPLDYLKKHKARR